MPKHSERKEALEQLTKAITLREIISLQTRTLSAISKTYSPHISCNEALIIALSFASDGSTLLSFNSKRQRKMPNKSKAGSILESNSIFGTRAIAP